MNKNLRKFSALILSAFLVAACGDDDKAVDPAANLEPEFPTEFSEKSVEENKSQLEDNGIALVNQLTDLKGSTGIQTSIAFSAHLEGSDKPDNLSGGRADANSGLKLIDLLAALGQGKASPADVASGMRTKESDFESVQKSYQDLIGVYAYNKSTDTWTYNKTGDKIVFQFPSKETGTTNNAEYAVYDYKSVTITGGPIEDYNGDYPTGLKADLTVDGTKKMSYSFEAGYDSKGTPTSMKLSITIDAFTLAYAVVNTTTDLSLDYSLTGSGKVLFAYGARSKGNFNAGDVADSEGPDQVFDSGSAYFQIMNIKFSGEVNIDALVKAIDAADTKTKEAAAWNANYKLIVFYADSKKKIADSEFYVVATEDYDCRPGDGNHDGQVKPGEQLCGMYPSEGVDVRLVFADGTKSDLETYTSVGFADLEKDLKELGESLE